MNNGYMATNLVVRLLQRAFARKSKIARYVDHHKYDILAVVPLQVVTQPFPHNLMCDPLTGQAVSRKVNLTR